MALAWQTGPNVVFCFCFSLVARPMTSQTPFLLLFPPFRRCATDTYRRRGGVSLYEFSTRFSVSEMARNASAVRHSACLHMCVTVWAIAHISKG